MDKSSNTDKMVERPEPDDLQAFLPWACAQLQLPKDVLIIRNLQTTLLKSLSFTDEYVSAVTTDRGKSKGKSKPRLPSVVDDQAKDEASVSQEETDLIRVHAVYDYADNLVGLRFDKNTNLPRMLMQILGLIIKFQIYLTSLTINQGLNKYVLYEIVNFLPNSRITDITLDNCFLSEGTYYTLLENTSSLRNLSLSRCRINDQIVALIAAQLYHPKPGSSTLVVLNLSSNRITDVGVRSIREALKMNTKLAYLNLADNFITDEGAAAIFNILLEFPLKPQEVMDMKSRHIDYLRNKQAAVIQIAKDLRVTDMVKGKVKSTPRLKAKGKDDIASEKSACYSDAYFYEKARTIADSLTTFKDPYSSDNVTYRDEVTYCLGNNILYLLNLSYNGLSYPSVVKFLEVLVYQRDMERKPRGLLTCRVEGNPLPVGCKEMVQIEEMLEYALAGPGKRPTAPIKKKGK
ncbi:uncharacterized protein LOC134751505 [Cydia strobilella]|uniref:uncharacterized protein LOC134751505 n=1 Tax=Cydia strobilella TaxID=1100964 RepID=UPI0030072EE9